MGDGWSVAWRVLDAQFWGVPQRRRRIALVADFGGESAPEILFNPGGVQGNPSPSGKTRERAAEAAERGAGTAGGALNPWDSQSARIYADDAPWHSLSANEGGGQSRDAVFCRQERVSFAVRERGGCAGGGKGPLVQEEISGTITIGNDQTFFCLQGNGIDRADTAGCNGKGWREDVSYTLNTIDHPAVCAAFKAGQGEKAGGIGYSEKVSPMLSSSPSGTNRTPAILDMSHACDVIRDCGGVVPSLQARMGTGGNQVPLTFAFGRSDALTESDVVRRLTPLECERLQGFPTGWTDIGAWTDSKGKLHKESSDSARYKAMGNSIALPPWKWVLKRLCANYERDATLGSLFDGVGGFPLIWSQLNGVGSVKWASEIEEFQIAVTKRHCEEGLI